MSGAAGERARLRAEPVDRATGRPTLLWWILIGLFAVQLLAVGAPIQAALYGVPVGFALLLTLVQCLAVLLAPVLPRIAIGLFTVASLAVALLAERPDGPWPWAVTAMIGYAALVGLTTLYRGWVRGLWALAVPGVAVTAAALIDQRAQALADLVVATSIAAAVFLITLLIGERRRIAAQLVQERELTAAEQERRALAEERQRIARELHDVVAHGMSLIQVQATTARYRLPDLPAEAAAEFDDIGASARSSLAEMRRLLGVLRGDEGGDRTPQGGIADLPQLVERARRSGADIRLDLAEVLRELPASVDIAAYRIVQEAVSNALRHAPGGSIAVSVAADAEAGPIRLSVTNAPATRAAAPTRATGPGHGLVGMRERVSLVGGRLEHGPRPDGGYRVHAVLPLHGSEPS